LIRPRDRTTTVVIILTGAAVLLTLLGWKLFWFLTDDAYIAFRYISNSRLGYGYVWNAPPCRPVEGYTSFLWVALLDGAWRLFGIEPPRAANPLALLFSLGTLGLTVLMVLRLPWPSERERLKLPMLGLVLAGVVTNRTFLTWASSGLETAMFNFLLMAWVFAALFSRAHFPGRPLGIAACAAGIYLTRPDGLLFAVATLPFAWLATSGEAPRARWRALWTLAPLLVIPIHLAWRRSFYGEWLPNTYFAKYTGPWPESGWRYAASFVLEYAVWIWIALAAGLLIPRVPALMRELRAAVVSATPPVAPRAKALRATPGAATTSVLARAMSPAAVLARTLVVATLVLHLLYYTFVIGGDHFEYRVYSHLVPLLLISLVWMLQVARVRARLSLIVVAAAVLLALPVPWSHWALTHRLATRDETFQMRVPIAPRWPAPVRWYASAFDGLQYWLIDRVVCVRHQEHRVLQQLEIARYPTRAEGARIGPAGNPVIAGLAVGVVGWVMPHVRIIDLWGLNDYVVARSDRIPVPKRQMAHDREPPAGYVECFQPNVTLAGPRRAEVLPRETELTDAQIATCETRWRAWVRNRR
jgi:arabinofuranosyltransferase